MDYLSLMKHPIEKELERYSTLFCQSLSEDDGLLGKALEHIRNREGKGMRPILINLIAKSFGPVSDVTTNAAVGLELLHTASLVHDDVVDESMERRGQPSVNSVFDSKIAVLVGDYLLSSALYYVSLTRNNEITEYFSEIGRILASGEILQLSNINCQEISEDTYYKVITQKTATLFEACAAIGSMSVGAPADEVIKAKEFGKNIGIIFQIRDDIFDYFDSDVIGKPTGNDMIEGKLTLPVIFALNSTNSKSMRRLAMKVKERTITSNEISQLIEFTKNNGGIEYAEAKMDFYAFLCESYISQSIKDNEIKKALNYYLEFVIKRES